MKRNYILLAIIASAMTFVSCSSNEDELSNNDNKKIEYATTTISVASPGANDETRAYVVDLTGSQTGKRDLTVNWSSTDKLALWGYGISTPSEMTYSAAGNNGNYATFTGSVPQNCSQYFAIYPYQSDATLDGDQIYAKIPAEQYAYENTFDPAAAICSCKAASTAVESVSLLHCCAFLKIEVPQACNSISVTSTTTNWYLAGKVKIDASSSGGKITAFKDASGNAGGVNTVTLKPKSGSTIAKGIYLIAIASSTKFPGLSVTVDYGSGKTTTASTPEKTYELAAGYIYNLGTAPTK